MAATEDPQLAQILAETVSELRVLRRQLATATEGLPMVRRPGSRAASRPAPVEQATATARTQTQALQADQAVASRVNPSRLSAEAVQKPHKPLAPRAPAGPAPEPRAYSWEATVKSLRTRPGPDAA